MNTNEFCFLIVISTSTFIILNILNSVLFTLVKYADGFLSFLVASDWAQMVAGLVRSVALLYKKAKTGKRGRPSAAEAPGVVNGLMKVIEGEGREEEEVEGEGERRSRHL